jgi:hypothetical protein
LLTVPHAPPRHPSKRWRDGFITNPSTFLNQERWKDTPPAGEPKKGKPRLKRDDFSSNRHPALAYWWSMIFAENRCPLFGIML